MSIYTLYKRFPDVHPNIILKTDVLRQGIAISKAAAEQFRQMEDVLWKGFHFFSYDRQKTVVYSEKVPNSLRLEDGCPMQIRTNIYSPYSLDFVDSEFVISENNEPIAKGIYFDPKPKWYGMKLEDGTPMEAIVQGQSGHLLFIIFNNYCEMWNTNAQCLFCNINTTLREQKAGGEDLVARKDPEVLAEVVKTAVMVDPNYRFILVSGGTILGKYRGQTELEFYCSRLNAIRERLKAWLPLICQIAAHDDEGWKRLYDTGIASIQPNIEVWDKRLFEWICPGKAKFIGYDEWIRRTIRAVDFWGSGMVNPNFVLGVEMAKPYGFEDVSSAVKSTSSGWDFLMSHGVLPRYNMWFIEAGAALASQEPPPFEFFIEAEKAYAELRWKHGFEPPFPSAQTRYTYLLNCLQDWEYYHGTGTLSKQKQEARLAA